MADEKAVERAAAIDDNSNTSMCSASSQPDRNAQGESLFLPYLVEHLRSSLQQQHHQQQPVPPARRRRQASQPAVHSECGRVEDSGTESGEDLRFLAAGLKDSIELHRKGTPREQDSNQGILSEVQSALSRLQSSLRQGCIGTEQVDSSKQDSLLQLIERLQTSLQLPSAGSSWQKQSKPADLPHSGSSQRFAGRRNKRAQRHTVGVTREELADVRRFLEEKEMRNKMDISSEDKPPDVPPLPVMKSSYELVKQCSAGDVPTVGSQGSAFRPFRPNHFLPKQFEGPPPQYLKVEESPQSGNNTKSKHNAAEIKNPMSDEETEDDSEDDDTDFVEEKAVVGKAFKGVNEDNAHSANYDPSSNLFTPSQSVQIAVHKAAIMKQLSLEEEKRKESRDTEPETSDEDTMTDVSYESETEKAESDGYEEEDKEYEEDEVHEKRNARSNTKNVPSQVGVVRNSTYTIQSKNVNTPKKLLEKDTREKRQDMPYNDKNVQSQSKQSYYNDKKRVQKEPEVRMMDNKAYISAQQLRAPQYGNKGTTHHIQQRSPPSYVHHDVNQKYIEAVIKTQADQLNGKGVKSTGKDVSRTQRNDAGVEDRSRQRQDQNNNRPSEISSQNGVTVERASNEQKQGNVAPNDSPKATRFANRQLKRQKMKRANTIDIPKPLHYYDVEDESDASSDVDSQKEIPIETTRDFQKKSVQKTTTNTTDNVQRLQQKQSNDRTNPNPQKIEKKVKQIFEDGADAENPSYNPQAHGGAQWNSRFANIKTCFENPSPKEQISHNKKQSDGVNRARSFWRSADDSTLKVSKNSAFHDPKLTKQGSQFLKKLHEQKDQGQTVQKLPWTVTEHENVVVGSLVVPANVTKAVQPASHQGPVNKFSHAPMSAFRPIEKKNPATTGHTPWAAPSVTGSVKQIATSKFSLPEPQPPPAVYKQEPPKQSVKASLNIQPKPTAPAPVSPTLPWTKDVSHGHNLNSTLAKFESMSSRESSPQLMPNALLRSHSQDRVASNFAMFNKNVPVPPPRTYIPVPQTNMVQTRTQNLTSQHRPELPFIPEQHPHPLTHSKSNQYLPQGNYYSGPIKNHPLLEGDNQLSDSDDEEPPPSSSRLVLSTLQGNIEPQPLRNETAPVQTYSAGVTARQSIYGVVQQPFIPKPAPMPEENVSRTTYYDQEPTHVEFPEEHTAAVTRVMGQQQCQAAVTVSHKTRHCNEEEEGERGSAAFHLASLLHKFSDDVPATKAPAPKDVQPKPKHSVNSPENWTSMPVQPAPKDIQPKPKHSVNSPENWTSTSVQHAPKDIQPKPKHSVNSPENWTSTSVQHAPKDIQPKPKHSVNSPENWTSMSVQHAPKDIQPKPKHSVNSPENWTSMAISPAQKSSLPPKPEGSPRLARSADTGYNRTVETRNHPLPVYSDPDRLRAYNRPVDRPPQVTTTDEDSPDFVYSSHFEIPLNKVQNITMKFQSLKESQNETADERKPPVSPNPGVVLRKSESWHQLAAQQQGLSRRPQSMVVTDLPPVKPRSPNPLPKAKSSHSLAFPKQFEAAIKPEALEKKQKTVEEFLKKGKIETKSSNTKSSGHRHVKISQSTKSYSAESMMLLDDNMENVDEAFESLFNATSSDSKTKFTKTTRQDNKGPTSRIAHR